MQKLRQASSFAFASLRDSGPFRYVVTADVDTMGENRMRETRLIGILPAGLLRGFPLPRRHWIRLRPQAFVLGPGQFFHVPKSLALGCTRP